MTTNQHLAHVARGRTLHVATIRDGSYMQFHAVHHAYAAVEGYAHRHGLRGCRWTKQGVMLDADGRIVGETGKILGNKLRGPGVVSMRVPRRTLEVVATN